MSAKVVIISCQEPDQVASESWFRYQAEVKQLNKSSSALAELYNLTVALGWQVAAALSLPVPARIRPATYFNNNTIERIAECLAHVGHTPALASENDYNDQQHNAAIQRLIIDGDLTPRHLVNLAKQLKIEIIDRTELILQIFAIRARSHEGKIQVALAKATHERNKLVRAWGHLERQRGGFGFLAGPGEAQLEIDRRLLQQRVSRLTKSVAALAQRREQQRQTRKGQQFFHISLVGYTNVGKTSLFNRLTASSQLAENKPFATLDPVRRKISLRHQPVNALTPTINAINAILIDSVGLIRNLPPLLHSAFHATFAEISASDLLIHVIDGSASYVQEQYNQVQEALENIFRDQERPEIIEFVNKTDLTNADAVHSGWDGNNHTAANQRGNGAQRIYGSVLTNRGIDELLATIIAIATRNKTTYQLQLPAPGASAQSLDEFNQALSWLYTRQAVLINHESVTNKAECNNHQPGLLVALDNTTRRQFLHRFTTLTPQLQHFS